MSFFSSKKTKKSAGDGADESNVSHDMLTQNQDAPHASTSSAAGSEDESRPDLSPEDAKKHAVVGKQLAAAFGELVTLIMRSETDRKRPISDLEWMIAPAIATGQFAIADAQSKKSGAISPVGAVTWAMVSEDIDKVLSDTSTQQPKLSPNDWRSGSIPWIVMAIGDKRVVAGLIAKLTQSVFKDQAPKIRSKDSKGNIVVGRVKLADPSASNADPVTH